MRKKVFVIFANPFQVHHFLNHSLIAHRGSGSLGEKQRTKRPIRYSSSKRRSRNPSRLTQHVDMAFSDDPFSHHSSIPSSSTMDTTRSASTNDSTWRVLSFSFPHLQTLPSMFSLSALVLICPILAASVLTAIERTRTTRWWFSTK